MRPVFSARRSIASLVAEMRAGRLRARDLVDRCLSRIATHDPTVNAFITVFADEARAEARDADAAAARGMDRGPLHGIPISVKDIIDMAGVPTTAASQVRAGHRATADADVVTRLRAAGAIMIGKCNLHEFAFGTTGEESAFGPTRNPHDAERIPGGSSSGSAVSVATGMAVASIGTDTGGSIRIPASACGVVGLKPSFGEVSMAGVVPLAPTLDHVGPLTRTVADAALVYGIMRTGGAPAPTGCGDDRVRVGVPRSYFFDRLDSSIGQTVEAAVRRLEVAAVTVTEVDIRHAGDAPAVYLHTQLPEAAVLHRPTLDAPAGYSPGVRARLELGRYVLAEDYLLAQRGRRVLTGAVDAALAETDVLLVPTLPIVPPRLGADTVAVDGVDETVRALTLRLTQVFDLTGHPAVSIPCGVINGVPVGLQLVGRRGATPELLAVATRLEPVIRG